MTFAHNSKGYLFYSCNKFGLAKCCNVARVYHSDRTKLNFYKAVKSAG
jgi:hypothetical protein